jgi:prevent-host-death family protein
MICKVQKQIRASDFRKNLAQHIKDAKEGPVVISRRGSDTRVLIDINLYNALVEAYERCQKEENRAY